MSLKPWLERGLLQAVETSDADLDRLLAIADRDLADARLEALSPDRRFATAYGAALNLACFVIRQQGYRVLARQGHHRTSFEAAGALLGKSSRRFINYFDFCRRKRNKVDYEFSGVVSRAEVVELLDIVVEFREFVLRSPR